MIEDFLGLESPSKPQNTSQGENRSSESANRSSSDENYMLMRDHSINLRNPCLYELMGSLPSTVDKDLAKLISQGSRADTGSVLKYFIIGSDVSGKWFKILKVFRKKQRLLVEEDVQILTSPEIRKILYQVDKALQQEMPTPVGEKSNSKQKDSPGLKLLCRAHAFLGFLRLVHGDHFVFVEQAKTVASILEREIFSVKKLQFISGVKSSSQNVFGIEEDKDADFVNLLNRHLDVDQHLFYSFDYDLTHPFQWNCTTKTSSYNFIYTFNWYTASRFLKSSPNKSDLKNYSKWVIPVIQGYVGARDVNMCGSSLYESIQSKSNCSVVLIARRSRFFAGTRYNRRGLHPTLSNHGFVANEVESEIIISTGNSVGKDKKSSSLVFIRGSIPLFWTQVNPRAPKPEIKILKREDDFKSTVSHFERLNHKYGGDIIILNLVKQVGKEPVNTSKGQGSKISLNKFSKQIGFNMGETGEPSLGKEYFEAVQQVQSSLKKFKISYNAYDFHFQRKAKMNYVGEITDLLRPFSQKIGFFGCEGSSKKSFTSTQRGVVRVNCIDNLDRTNIGQFCTVMSILPEILRFLGLLQIGGVSPSDDILDELNLEESHPTFVDAVKELFKEHGDFISLQYGGSRAMHSDPLKTSRVRDSSPQKSSKIPSSGSLPSMDKSLNSLTNAVTALQRYYANNVSDGGKQEAIDLFLGYFVPTKDLGSLTAESIGEFGQDRRKYGVIEFPLVEEMRVVDSKKLSKEPKPFRHHDSDWLSIDSDSEDL